MIIGVWKLVLATLAITELSKGTAIKNKKYLPWLSIAIAIVISLLWALKNGGGMTEAVWRGLGVGVLTTGLYKGGKSFLKSIFFKRPVL
ncbi:MAG: hypothetical protein UV43_C0058G0013 [Parcubacteria group bacterium GW2011_GWF2_42_7]|nr:MAG: hypothetical protein UV43_C0058G0013 [Parcubacteria group bacterium GW2011_GWF2_42_7]